MLKSYKLHSITFSPHLFHTQFLTSYNESNNKRIRKHYLKYEWVWNGVHSALVRINEELPERKVVAPV
jgi:hypothetical protein